jgi:hypothetical protein
MINLTTSHSKFRGPRYSPVDMSLSKGRENPKLSIEIRLGKVHTAVSVEHDPSNTACPFRAEKGDRRSDFLGPQ